MGVRGGVRLGCCATSLKCSFLLTLTSLNMKMTSLKDGVLGYGLFRILWEDEGQSSG